MRLKKKKKTEKYEYYKNLTIFVQNKKGIPFVIINF